MIKSTLTVASQMKLGPTRAPVPTTAMPLPKLSPEVQAMRLRLRHIHIPDLPPLYAPRFLAPKIRDHIEGQIKQMRSAAGPDTLQSPDTAEEAGEDAPRPFGRPLSSFGTWLKGASPPPTVLSFTRRPTYVLPKHQLQNSESWEAQYLTSALKSRMQVKFPSPPQWSPSPWMPFWEQNKAKPELKFDPLNHEWPAAGIMVLPCAEPMYLGPGQVSMWPIMDMKDDVQRGKKRFRTKYEYERVLEDTTIEVLKREYGIEAFAIPGTPGVWVESKIPPPEIDSAHFDQSRTTRAENRRENVRRIATIHASITDDITQWGVSIHVGQPDPIVDGWTSLTNPWTPTRQHKSTTSIVAELAHTGTSPRHASRTNQADLYSHRKTRYLQTYFNKDAPFAGTMYHSMPYSLIKVQDGRREPAPLGLDNRDLSSAWTYEFGRQLGMHDGFIDHYGVVDFAEANATHLPIKTPRPGFMSRPLLDEHWLTNPYEQVDVPSVMVGKNELVSSAILGDTLRLESKDGKIDSDTHEGWMLSWPLWQDTLMKKLDQSIAGGAWDTRLRTHTWDKEQSARQVRRKVAVKETEDLQQQWSAQTRQLIRRPLTDEIIQQLTDRTREMERILREGAQIGGVKSQELLESAATMRRLLESRFPRQDRVRDKSESVDALEQLLSQMGAAASLLKPSPTASPEPTSSEASSLRPASSSPIPSTQFDNSPSSEDAMERALNSAWSEKPSSAERTNTELRAPRGPLRNERRSDEHKPVGLFGGKRTEFVKFTETRNEQIQSERRQKGRKKAEERRKAQPAAVTTRPTTPGGVPSFLPRTQHISWD